MSVLQISPLYIGGSWFYGYSKVLPFQVINDEMLLSIWLSICFFGSRCGFLCRALPVVPSRKENLGVVPDLYRVSLSGLCTVSSVPYHWPPLFRTSSCCAGAVLLSCLPVYAAGLRLFFLSQTRGP